VNIRQKVFCSFGNRGKGSSFRDPPHSRCLSKLAARGSVIYGSTGAFTTVLGRALNSHSNGSNGPRVFYGYHKIVRAYRLVFRFQSFFLRCSSAPFPGFAPSNSNEFCPHITPMVPPSRQSRSFFLFLENCGALLFVCMLALPLDRTWYCWMFALVPFLCCFF